ncbi:MAG: hypothetical protein JKY09_05770, partial [Crocinitomicaceae bacterium]|nr:hypothetical protein [Crocinitomicaceae bacterium]
MLQKQRVDIIEAGDFLLPHFIFNFFKLMSTRCMIQVDNHGEIINLYHHSDGYYLGVGLEIALKLHKWNYHGIHREWSAFKRRLPKGYETVEYTPEGSEDLEYVYTLKIDTQGIFLTGFERCTWEERT